MNLTATYFDQNRKNILKGKSLAVLGQEVLENIRDGSFTRDLKQEYDSNLRQLTKFDDINNRRLIYQTQLKINKLFK